MAVDWQKFLAGGLPAILELPESQAKDNRDPEPEQTKPEPTNRDVEPFLMRVTQNQILGATGVILLFLGLVYVIRK